MMRGPTHKKVEKEVQDNDGHHICAHPAIQENDEHDTCTPAMVPNMESFPAMPKTRKERQEGIKYRHLNKGCDVIVKWKGGHIVCTCKPSGLCRGELRLDRCQLSKDVTQDPPPVEGKRAREGKDYGLMESGPLGGAGRSKFSRDTLYAGEAERLQNLVEIPRYGRNDGPIVVCEKGRWGEDLMLHEGWAFKTCGITFPLRVGSRWRKSFTGRHAVVVKKKEVTIVFEIVQLQSSQRSRGSWT